MCVCECVYVRERERERKRERESKHGSKSDNMKKVVIFLPTFFILSDLDPYLLPYFPIKKQIPNTLLFCFLNFLHIYIYIYIYLYIYIYI